MTDEFRYVDIGRSVDLFLTFRPTSARLSAAVSRALGNPKRVTVMVNDLHVLKITPCEEDHPRGILHIARGEVPRLIGVLKNAGFELGRFAVEARDGSAYVQMTKAGQS